MSKPWERNWNQSDGPAVGGKPWEQDWSGEQRQGKKTSRERSAWEGLKAGESLGFRDEAEGGQNVWWDGVNRVRGAIGMPEASQTERQAMNFLTSRTPARAITGIRDAALGTAAEMGALGDRARETAMPAIQNRRQIQETAREDNPLSFFGGELAGGMAIPVPFVGAGRATVTAGAAGARAVAPGTGSRATRAAMAVWNAPGRAVGAVTSRLGPRTQQVLGSAHRGAVVGAPMGAAYGAGNAQGGIEERLMGAGEGAIIGGLTGAVANPLLEHVASPLLQGMGRKFFGSQEGKALDMIIKRAERSGTDLNAVRNQFDTWRRTGEVPETLAELMGPQERQLLSAMVTASRESRETAGGVLLERGRGEVERLEGAFADAFGATRDDFTTELGNIRRARSEDPEPLYRAAHFDQNGTLRRLTPEQQASLNNTLSDEGDAARILNDAMSDLNRSDNVAARDEIRRYADALARAKAGERVQMPDLSIQAADYIERAVNETLRGVTRGTANVSGSARGWRNLRTRIRGAIDDGTGLADARALAAERIRRGELLDEGRDIMKKGTDVEDVRAVMRGDEDLGIPQASPEGRRAYGIGAMRAVSGELRDAPDMRGFADVARRVAATPNLREKLETARPRTLTRSGAEDRRTTQTRMNQQLDQAIERTANRADFTTDLIGNSRTAFRLNDVADASIDDQMAVQAGNAISDLLISGPGGAVAGGIRRFGQGVGDRIARPGIRNPGINREATRVLLATGEEIPVQIGRLVQRVQERANRAGFGRGAPRPLSGAIGSAYSGIQGGAAARENPYVQDYDNMISQDIRQGIDEPALFSLMDGGLSEDRRQQIEQTLLEDATTPEHRAAVERLIQLSRETGQ
jgi:hypothetical protein